VYVNVCVCSVISGSIATSAVHSIQVRPLKRIPVAAILDPKVYACERETHITHAHTHARTHTPPRLHI